MTQLKTSKVIRASANIYYRGEYGNSVCVDSTDNIIYFGEDAFDGDTLFPLQDRKPTVLESLKGLRRYDPWRQLLLDDKPVAWTDHGRFHTDEAILRNSSPRTSVSIYARNDAYTRVMDASHRHNTGSLFSFEDSAGVKHFVLSPTAQEVYTTENVAATKYISLVQGESMQSAVASVRISFTTVAPTGISNASYYWLSDYLQPFYVDTVNKRIFCFAHYRWGFSSNTAVDSILYQTVVYFSYTTVADGGSLNISGPTHLFVPTTTTQPGATIGYTQQLHFLGESGDGQLCFMQTSENAATPTLVANGCHWQGTTTSWNKNDNHRMVFYKFDKASLTRTTAADLSGSDYLADTSRVKRFSGIVCNSTFVASPIAGETNIYYAYSLAFSATTLSEATFIRIKWNKTNDSFSLSEFTVDVPLSTYYNDVIGQYTSIATDIPYTTAGLNISLAALISATNLVLSQNSAGQYVLSVLSTLGSSFSIGKVSAKNSNIVSYLIDDTDFANGTFLQSVNAGSVYSYIAGDTDHSELLTITPSSIDTWSLGAGGWSLTSRNNGVFTGFGKDSTGRYWAVSVDGDASTNHAMSLHTVIPSAAQRVVVSFADSSINYAGTTLNKNVVVNAYDEGGARVETTVILKLTGGNATFTSNGARTLSVTTSAAADTTVGLTIVGAGLINISASFEAV